jgi:iron(III) transport system permease protein
MKSSPQRILAILFFIVLAYVVFVPLLVMLQETFLVHPMERFQIPGAMPGDLTLHHWKTVFTSSTLYKPLMNSLIIAVSLGFFSVVIGGALAWLVVRTDMPYKKVISNLAMIPYIMPSWTMTLAWITIFKNQRIGGTPGIFQYVTGIAPPDWISYGMLPIIICLTLHYFPFGFMLIGGALRNVDSQLEESAELLGASRWQNMRKIIIPIVLPTIFSTFLLTFSRGLGTFGAPSFLGGPVRLYVLSTLLYSNLVGQRTGMAYIISLIMILFGVLVLYMDNKVLGSRKSFVTISGKSGYRGVTSLGKMAKPVGLAVVLLMVVITIVPLVVLGIDSVMLLPGRYELSNFSLHYWIGEARSDIGLGTNVAGILRNPQILEAFGNSVKLAISTALICGLLGMLIGYTVVRLRGTRLSQVLDQLSFMPYLIPSIAFGSIFLALFGVPRGPIPGLYGTFALLVLACVVKSLPYSTRSGIGAMMQIGPELEEAGVMVGASWVQRLKRIILPLQKGPFFSGLLLPFISAMRELSLVVLLVAPGTQLATTITIRYTERGWTAYANGIMILIVAAVLILEYASRRLLGTDLAKGIGG